jgi:hypothetical protein
LRRTARRGGGGKGSCSDSLRACQPLLRLLHRRRPVRGRCGDGRRLRWRRRGRGRGQRAEGRGARICASRNGGPVNGGIA